MAPSSWEWSFVACAVAFCSSLLLSSNQELYVTSGKPALLSRPSLAPSGILRSETSSGLRATYVSNRNLNQQEDSVVATTEVVPSTFSIGTMGFRTIQAALLLAAAGFGLRLAQPRPALSDLEVIGADHVVMAAAAGKKKKVKKTKKTGGESKPEGERVKLTAEESQAWFRKTVLRKKQALPERTKTTGRVCALLGVQDNRQARSVSFSHRRTKRVQGANLHWRRLWWEQGQCFVRLRLSTRGIKTITRYGLQNAALKFGLDLTQYKNGISERKYIKYLPQKEQAIAQLRGADLRYKSAVRQAKLNGNEPPPPPSAAKKSKVESIAMFISHGCKVPRLHRPADERKALLRSLTTELIRYGRIKTTAARAKALRKHVDHMITLAKGGSLHDRRQALAFIYDKDLVRTLFEQVPDRYSSRDGGYTRILRTMPRKGDGAKMCFIELV